MSYEPYALAFPTTSFVLESDDFDAALSAIGDTDVAQRWTADMERYFEPGTVPGAGGVAPVIEWGLGPGNEGGHPWWTSP